MHLGLDLLFLVPDETGGRETYARELISAMFAVEPELTATAFVNRNATPGLLAELCSVMRVVRIPVSARRPEQWALGEFALLPVAGRRERIDVLHSLANFGPASGPFRRVITLHDLQYRALPELLTPVRRRGTAALLEPAVRRAHRVITGSAFSRDAIVSALGITADRIDVIAYGLGAHAATSPLPESELRERHGLGERPVVLAVASDLPHKNLRALIDAADQIPAERRPVIVIAGPGTDGQRLQDQARAAGLEGDVRLLGFIAADELEGLYAIATCVVLPSLYEGFGLPVLEAMSRGVPVACSDIPAMRAAAGDAALGFAPDRPQDIAAALERLIGDAALRSRLAEAGRARAKLFSWTNAAEETMESYRRALAAGER